MVSQAGQGLWWSHRQSVYGFKDFLLWAASASPMCAASALGTVPTLHCKTRLEFLTVSLPRHKLQLQSFLHPANSGGGTPLGVLLTIFTFSCLCGSFPMLLDLFRTPKGSTQPSKLPFKNSSDLKLVWFFWPTWSQITSYRNRDWPSLISFAGLPTRTK